MLDSRSERSKRRKIVAPDSLRVSGKTLLRGGLAAVTVAVIAWWAVLTWTHHRWESLEREKQYWQESATQAENSTVLQAIPTLEALPEILESCREEFHSRGVKVANLNMNSIAETISDGHSTRLAYGLVRLQFQGPSEKALAALAALEKAPDKAVHVRELTLEPAQGEVLLQVFFAPAS